MRRGRYGMTLRSGYGNANVDPNAGWGTAFPSANRYRPDPVEQEQTQGEYWGPTTFKNPQAQEQWNYFDSLGGQATRKSDDPYGATGERDRIARMVADDRANSAYNADGTPNLNSPNGRYLAGILRRLAAPDDGRGTEQRAFSVGGPRPNSWGSDPEWNEVILMPPDAKNEDPMGWGGNPSMGRINGDSAAIPATRSIYGLPDWMMGQQNIWADPSGDSRGYGSPSRNYWDQALSEIGLG